MEFIICQNEHKLDAIVKKNNDFKNIVKYMGDFFSERFINRLFDEDNNDKKNKNNGLENSDTKNEIIKEIERVNREENNNKPKSYLVRYYYCTIFQKKQLYNFYVYMPGGLILERVSHHALGPGVLGRAFPGLNLIQIREDLYGNDFEEVKKHEVNHIIFPYLNESEIRSKTKSELPFYTRFQ
jgi:hypothetical protein